MRLIPQDSGTKAYSQLELGPVAGCFQQSRIADRSSLAEKAEARGYSESVADDQYSI